MADNPLVKFLDDTLKQAKDSKKDADDQLKTAQAELDAKRKDQAAAATKLKGKQQEISTIRAKLAGISTSDDGQALLDQFRTATLAAHQAQGDLLAAEDAVAQAVATLAERAAVVSAAATRAANATAALAEAKQQATTRDALKDAAAKPPVSTLKTDADNASVSEPFTKAKARLAADFTTPLFDCAEARFAAEQARVRRARDSKTVFDDLAVVDNVAVQSLALQRAVADLQEIVQSGVKNLTQAGTTFANVADNNQAKLTADEIHSIQGKKKDGSPDDDLIKKRGDAATACANLSKKQQRLDDDQAALDDARLKARADGVAEADVEKDADVTHARDALKISQRDLDAAKNVFGQKERDTMTEWAAAVPDANWQLLADYENANIVLTNLSKKQPADLVKVMTDAEAALIKALQESASAPLRQDLIRRESARRTSLRDAQTDAFSRRAFSAMRSDYF